MENKLGKFGRYLTVWVILCMAAGILIGQYFPVVPKAMSRLTYANVSLPVAVLIWLMIFPMMLKVDFASIKNAAKKPKGLTLTCVVNWLIKPFTMYVIAAFFLKGVFSFAIDSSQADAYLAGAILLGAAPCTAMVFVWSYLTDGDAGYTVVQVALNDIILLFAFTPIVIFLLGITQVTIPYDTLLLSVALFVVIPLVAGYWVRRLVIQRKGLTYFETVFLKKFDKTTIFGLLATLVLIFSFQGETILSNPVHILLIAVPLILQTVLIYGVAYFWGYKWHLPHRVAAPAALIGASNFFELAVAVAIALFGLESGATLATVVGVLVEVPVMLMLVAFSNKTKGYFKEGAYES